MAFQSRELYRSGPNGDRWFLARDSEIRARLRGAQTQRLVRRTNITNGNRGFPRARRPRARAPVPHASYRHVGREDRAYLPARGPERKLAPLGGLAQL